MSQPTPTQMNALLQYAAARLGIPAEQLAATVAEGGYDTLASSLSADSRRTLESLVGNPKQAEALLSSPAVQAYLKRFRK